MVFEIVAEKFIPILKNKGGWELRKWRYIDRTVKEPEHVKFQTKVSVLSTRTTLAICATNLCHSTSLSSIRALLKETLRGWVAITLDTVAWESLTTLYPIELWYKYKLSTLRLK
jgi:hypothetical protein